MNLEIKFSGLDHELMDTLIWETFWNQQFINVVHNNTDFLLIFFQINWKEQPEIPFLMLVKSDTLANIQIIFWEILSPISPGESEPLFKVAVA